MQIHARLFNRRLSISISHTALVQITTKSWWNHIQIAIYFSAMFICNIDTCLVNNESILLTSIRITQWYFQMGREEEKCWTLEWFTRAIQKSMQSPTWGQSSNNLFQSPWNYLKMKKPEKCLWIDIEKLS